MATEAEKAQIREYAAEEKSVNWIKDELDIPKSTVYYHFKKEVGQKQKENRPIIPDDLDFKGELCGIFAGDGSFQKDKNHNYKVKIHLNHKERYWKTLKEYLEDRLGKSPFKCKPQGNKVSLLYNSKKIYSLFQENLDWSSDKTATIQLKDEENSRSFKIGFLRGLIDTDGYMRPDHRRYVFTSASKGLRNDFSEILSRLEIDHTCFLEEDGRDNRRTKYKVRVTGKDVVDFNRLVSPRNPKKQLKSAASGI